MASQNSIDIFLETNILKNPIALGLLTAMLSIYGPRLHPKLPPVIRNLFNNSSFRFIIILMIIYISSKDLILSFIIAISFIFIFSLTTTMEIKEKFIDSKLRQYSDFDSIRETFENPSDNLDQSPNTMDVLNDNVNDIINDNDDQDDNSDDNSDDSDDSDDSNDNDNDTDSSDSDSSE